MHRNGPLQQVPVQQPCSLGDSAPTLPVGKQSAALDGIRTRSTAIQS